MGPRHKDFHLPLLDKGPDYESKGRNGYFRNTTLTISNKWGSAEDLFRLTIEGGNGSVNAQCYMTHSELENLQSGIRELLK